MNNDLKKLTESFRTKYESFITGCDSVEFDTVWDKAENGEMDVFFENELLSVILSLIISDGKISDAEVRYLNDSFGFSYTVDELKEVYENLGEEIENYFEENFKSGYAMLRGINDKLADAYKELFSMICEIIACSDGVSEEEKAMLAELTL